MMGTTPERNVDRHAAPGRDPEDPSPDAPLENDMDALIPLVALIVLAVLALRYGYDSRPIS